MTDAIQFANDRPTSLNDDLYQWAVDAEELIRKQDAEIAHWKAGCIDTKLRDAECKTLEDWRRAAMYYESNWSRCSNDFNAHAGTLRREIAKRDAEIAVQEEEIIALRDAGSALKAENLGYAKSLLDLEAEVERLTKQYEALRQAYGLMHGRRK
jgi:chromosome segregation ATPase